MRMGIPLKTCHSWVILVTTLICIKSCIAISLRDEFMLKDDEQQAFDRFKARVLPHIPTEYMTSDLVLIKYFRYCDMNETKAIERMKDNLKWRLDRAFEELSEDEINEHLRLYPYSSFPDKSGRAVLFIATKYWDPLGAFATPESTKKFIKYAYYVAEEQYKKRVSNITNRTATGIVFFLDLKDVQIQNRPLCVHCVDVMKDFVTQVELRYPEGVQLAYAVNGDPIVHQALNILRTTVSPKLQKLCFPFDEDDSIWLPELLKIIDKSRLPADLYIRSRAQPGPSFLGGAALPPGFGQLSAQPASAQEPDPKTSNKPKTKTKAKKKKKDGEDDDDDADADE